MFYRDASNYKFSTDLAISNKDFHAGALSYLGPTEPLGSLLNFEEPVLDYTKFGVTEERFHDAIEAIKTPDDHHLVLFTEIRIIPDTQS